MDEVIPQIRSASPQEHKIKNQPVLGPSQTTDLWLLVKGFNPLTQSPRPALVDQPVFNVVVKATGLGCEMCSSFRRTLAPISIAARSKFRLNF